MRGTYRALTTLAFVTLIANVCAMIAVQKLSPDPNGYAGISQDAMPVPYLQVAIIFTVYDTLALLHLATPIAALIFSAQIRRWRWCAAFVALTLITTYTSAISQALQLAQQVHPSLQPLATHLFYFANGPYSSLDFDAPYSILTCLAALAFAYRALRPAAAKTRSNALSGDPANDISEDISEIEVSRISHG